MEKMWPNGHKNSQYSASSGECYIGPNHRLYDNVQNQMVPSLRSNSFPASWQPNPVETDWQPSIKQVGWQQSATGTGWQPSSTRNSWQPSATEPGWHPSSTEANWLQSSKVIGWEPGTTGIGLHPSSPETSWQPTTMGNDWQQCSRDTGWHPSSTRFGWSPGAMGDGWQTSATGTGGQPRTTETGCQPETMALRWQSSNMNPRIQASNLETHRQASDMETGFQVEIIPTTTTETTWQPNSLETGLQANTTALSSQSSVMPATVDPSIVPASGDFYPSKPKDNADKPLASIHASVDSPADNTSDALVSKTPAQQMLESDHVWCEHCFPRQQVHKTDIQIHNINDHIDVLLISAKSTYLSRVEFENICEYSLNYQTKMPRNLKDSHGNPLLRCRKCKYGCFLKLEMRVHIYTKHEGILRKKLLQTQQDALTNPHLRAKINNVEPKLDVKTFCDECRPRVKLWRREIPSHKIIYHLDKLLISSKSSTVSTFEFKRHCDLVIENLTILFKLNNDSLGISLYECRLCTHRCYGRSPMKIHIFSKHEQILREKLTKIQEGATHLTNCKAVIDDELNPNLNELICKDCSPPRSIIKWNMDKHIMEYHPETFFIQYKPALMSNVEFIKYCENFIKNEAASCNKLQTSEHEVLHGAARSKLKCPYCLQAKTGEFNMRRHIVSVHISSLQEKFAQLQAR